MNGFFRVEGLVTRYGGIVALSGIDLTVEKGTITTIIGANGAGKSTLLLTISGILKPSAGSVAFEGREITGLPAHAIVKLGIIHVPEGRRIFSSLTVRENLGLAAHARGDKSGIPADIEYVFGLFPILKQRIDQKGGTLSGGEQQMLAIGRGIVAKPRLLLIDELSLGLAPIIALKLFDAIREINRSGTTVLLVEQNAANALKYSDFGHVIENGRIVLSDRSAELAENPDVRAHYLGG